ncbi:MAG: septation protein IspZ [Rhodobacteraceae bacterium]|nr:septation protein IspZ [Paracoccaceae bacterium]
METRKINPVLKFGLELGPVLAFFAAYVLLRDRVFTVAGTEYSGFIVATALFIPILLAATGALWALTGRLSKMQVVTAVLVVVFGGMSIAFNDERFFKMKPTIIYALFAAILGFGLLRGESYLQVVMEEVVPLDRAGWMILTRRVALLFAGLMVANEVIWRTFSTDAWVNFKTFGLPVATVAFFMAQGRLIERHAIKKDGKDV